MSIDVILTPKWCQSSPIFPNKINFYDFVNIFWRFVDFLVKTLSMNNINGELQNLVRNYLNKYPNITMNAFAQRADVSATTLRRVMSSDSNNPPSANTVLNIVSYVFKERRMSQLLTLVDGEIKDFLKSCFSSFIFEADNIEYNVDINVLLKDRENYLIYKLAANESGVAFDEIIFLFGESGRKKLLNLVQQEIIVDIGNRVYRTKCTNFSLDIKTAIDHIPSIVQFFKPEEAVHGKNMFYSLSESLTDQAIEKIVEVQMNAVKEVNRIMSDPKNFGIKPYFSIFVSDTLTLNRNEVLQ